MIFPEAKCYGGTRMFWLKWPRVFKRRRKQPSCSKHGPYQGPYCPVCYEKAMN